MPKLNKYDSGRLAV